MAARRTFSRRGGWSEPVGSAEYRSGLEENIAAQLTAAGIPVVFEQAYLKYITPVIKHTYTPDFVLPNGIIVESKGWLQLDDRKKHVLIKEQYPHLDIRFVFSNPSVTISKTSKTTYADWCKKHGFLYATRYIPSEWIAESQKDTSGLQYKKKRRKEIND